MKLHLGCGKNILEGWQNHDRDVDLRKPMPFGDETADFIFAEHVIEHLDTREALGFLRECSRVLKPRGIFRLSFPDPQRVAALEGRDFEAYATMLRRKGVDAENWKECVRSVFLAWGHRSAWTRSLAIAALHASGFGMSMLARYGTSLFDELDGIDGRHKDVGDCARLETTVLEARKELSVWGTR